VGAGNGFESQRPWASGATSPVGLTAISKHPYKNIRRFPQDSVNDAAGVRPVDAPGQTDGKFDPATNRWRGEFLPTYDAFFPEYYLSGIQTEHFIRDLSPFTTDIYGTPHGRFTSPPGGQPPTMWITEWNMDPSGADPSNPANVGGPPMAQLSSDDVKHMQAKAVLRFLAAWVNKGASAVYFFAVKHPNLSLVDPGFFSALQAGRGAYPGDASGGEAMTAMRRLVSSVAGAEPLSRTRSLSLDEVGDYDGHKQFNGDGTAAHPPLYDRDVVGFFPYQVNDHRFVIPTYVMTRSITKLYRPNAPANDATRYDLPDARFRLTIGGVRGNGRIQVTVSDPLSGRATPTRVISHSGDRLIVETLLTDSPRVLTIDESGAGATAGGRLELSDLRVSPRVWRMGSRLPRLSKRARKRSRAGTMIGFRLSAPATVELSFDRAKRARKSGRGCARSSRRAKQRKRCTRYVRKGSFSVRARAGLNQVRFYGKLSRRRGLKPGPYRVTVSATDAAGSRAEPQRAAFRALQARRR
jgi:hypothetical protein